MEARHVVQRVKAQGLDDTNERYGLYYRFVDPWQVRGHLYYLIVEDMGMNTHNTHIYTRAPKRTHTQVESHADGGGGGLGGAVGVLAEGTVGRMAVEPVRAGEAGDIPELERLGACVR